MGEKRPGLKHLQNVVNGQSVLAPIADLLGFKLTEVKDERAIIEFVATSRHANVMGTLHGGVICDIADAAMGLAYASGLKEDEGFTTVELKINFLRPVWNATLRADGRVIKRGRTIGLVECEITDEARRLVAKANCTCMTLHGGSSTDRKAITV